MVILDLGGGSALNITEQAAGTITGDRARPGGRGPIDHYGIAVASRASLDDMRQRLAAAGADVGQVQRLGDTCASHANEPAAKPQLTARDRVSERDSLAPGAPAPAKSAGASP
jgi:hypothetical protein